MFRNYFKTAIRNLIRNRVFTIINVLGLVLGITGAVVIYKVVSFEHSFEKYHTDVDRVYRINLVQSNDGDEQRSTSVMHPLGPALAMDYPGWITSRIHWYYNGVFVYENEQGVQKKIKQGNNMAFVEDGFFDIFDYKILAGDPNNILNNPNSIAMSAKGAEKLFGLNGSNYQSVIGKTLRFEGQLNLTITAIYENAPKNTDYGLDFLMSYEGARVYPYANNLTAWGTINGSTRMFVKIGAGETKEYAEANLKTSSAKYLENMGVNAEEEGVYFALQPLTSIHLDPDLGAGGYVDQSTLDGMQVIALILILTAAVNFINLATAQSVKRSKEVGIRKVLGSRKSQVATQFLGEVAIITMISILFSLALSEGVLMRLESILGYSLSLNLFSEPSTILFLVGLFLAVTLLSGVYPSLIVANYNPVHAIKSSSLTTKRNKAGISLRRSLVVFQFLISQLLIIGTLVVLFQMDFIKSQPLGFKSEGVLTFPIPERTEDNFDLLASRISSIAGVNDIGFFIATPGASSTNNIDRIKNPAGGEGEEIRANRKNVGPGYGKLFDLELISGAFYNQDSPDDHTVINRKLAESLGFNNPEQAIGQRFETNYNSSFYIVGVVEDFFNNSFHNSLDPVFMMKDASQYFEGGVSLTGAGSYQEVVDQVGAIWNEVFTADVFTYEFIEDSVMGQYETEYKISSLFQVFAGVAIFIGCLGLYGLISFMANQKVKEIGIRKVLGASMKNILRIFSKEVAVLVAIAFALACPLAYFMMNGWLDGYVYHIELGAGVFVLGVISTIIIASTTVGLKVLKSASANPINSLRDE